MSLIKLAETIEMSIKIPDDEKKIAEHAVLYLEKLIKKINSFNKHLDIMYNPFKDYQSVSLDSVKKYKRAIWNYREKIKENFKEIKKISLLCVKKLKHFDSDTHIIELLGSFSDDIGGIENQVNSLISVLSNWDTNNYKNNVVISIENLKKEIAELRKLINDRMIDHINENILSKNWIDNVSNDLNISIKEQQPLIIQLYEEREKQLKDMLSKERQ